MNKLVNVYPTAPITTINPPIRTRLYKINLSTQDIRKCLIGNAYVEEILEGNKTIKLTFENYEKNNDIIEKAVKPEIKQSEPKVEEKKVENPVKSETKPEQPKVEPKKVVKPEVKVEEKKVEEKTEEVKEEAKHDEKEVEHSKESEKVEDAKESEEVKSDDAEEEKKTEDSKTEEKNAYTKADIKRPYVKPEKSNKSKNNNK